MRSETGGRIYTRQAPKLTVADIENGVSAEYIHSAITQLLEQLKGLRRVTQDITRPVDEYVPSGASNAQSQVELLPQFDEQVAERITSIFLWGTAAATGTITLGDMTFPIVIPARGWDVIGPVSFLLGRNDRRLMALTGPPGDMGMRLMGWADERY